MDSFPSTSSISALPLSTILPLPVWKASFTPSYPWIVPPVGKSGAFTNSIKPSISIELFLMYSKVPLITSVKLCGGIFVAIPTAIPEAPFTRSAGIFVGRTVGSLRVSSKFNL